MTFVGLPWVGLVVIPADRREEAWVGLVVIPADRRTDLSSRCFAKVLLVHRPA